jgi:alpha-1,2-mannosyltransferase
MPAHDATRIGAAASAAGLLVAATFVVWGVARPLLRPDPYSDFATFYSAARCFASDCDAYDPQALRTTSSHDGWVGRYFYPPPFAAIAVRPLLALPFATARRVWVVVEAAAYVGAAWIAAGAASAVPFFATVPRACLTVALALPFAPIFLDLRLGSVSGLLLLCVTLSLRARAAARPRRAGFWLALAMVLKLAPAVLLLYWALRREWRLVGAACATAAVVIAASLPWAGIDAYRRYAFDVLPFLMSANFSWFTNQSLDAFSWRLLVPNPDTTPWIASPALQRVCTVAASLALVAGLAAAVRRGGTSGDRGGTIGDGRDALASTTVLAAAPLLSRVAWEYLFVLALPLVFVWATRIAIGHATRRQALAVAIAWFLCAAPFAYERDPPRSGAALLLTAPRTYGAVLLVVVSALVLRVRRDDEVAAR